MKPKAKKQGLDNSIVFEGLMFMDLNDDCIRHILCKLSATDLCSMSFTCKRLQELAFDHFPRQYPDERLTITIKRSETPYFVEEDRKKHLKYFSKCIRNVRIISRNRRHNLQSLFDFLNAECCVDLETLHLDIAGNVKTDNVEVLRRHLENLTTLSICSPYSRYDIHDVLLKYCRKLEYLKIGSYSNFDASWMLHEYPTIKSLWYKVRDQEQIIQFQLFAKKFFKLNPQIKNITCSENAVMETILLNVVNIERLDLHFDSWSQLHTIRGHLKDYSKQYRIKCFGLAFAASVTTAKDYKALLHVNAFQPIHCLKICLADIKNESTFISQLKFVIQLEIDLFNYGNQNELLTAISEQLPNLQDLQINYSNFTTWEFKDMAMKFIINSTRLQNLTITFNCHPRSTFIFHPNDLFELNKSRMAISHASPITIRMETYLQDSKKPVFIQPAQSMISLKFTSHSGYRPTIKNSIV